MSVDWDSVRAMALDCIASTLDLQRWAIRSQEEDYDVDSATLHLAAIKKARATFWSSVAILPMGMNFDTSDSLRHFPIFDQLALASAGESARPDFRSYATAHEAALGLLIRANLHIENSLKGNLAIEDLHLLSPEQLRDALSQLEAQDSIRSVLESSDQLYNLSAWIQREWAAVSAPPPQTRTKPKKPLGQGKTSRNTPNKAFDSAIQRIAQKLFPKTGQRRKTEDIVLHIYHEYQSGTKDPAKHIEAAYSSLWPKEIDNKPEGAALCSACEKIRASLNRIDALASKKRNCQRG
jgi:hypothetical protein